MRKVRLSIVGFSYRATFFFLVRVPRADDCQISPPLTAADEVVGRSVPSIGLPSELGDAFSGLSSMSLAVAEWIIDPRQV